MPNRFFIKSTFIFWFSALMIVYVFFDDVHLSRTLIDYLIMPIPSFCFAAIFTLITYAVVAIFTLFTQVVLRSVAWICDRLTLR